MKEKQRTYPFSYNLIYAWLQVILIELYLSDLVPQCMQSVDTVGRRWTWEATHYKERLK